MAGKNAFGEPLEDFEPTPAEMERHRQYMDKLREHVVERHEWINHDTGNKMIRIDYAGGYSETFMEGTIRDGEFRI